MSARRVALRLAAPLSLFACAGEAPVPAAAPPTLAAPTPIAPPHWSYDDAEGPLHWGDLDPSFAACKTGQAQSPIDLPATPSRHEPAPDRPRWDPVPLHVTNNGHVIQIDDTAPSSFVFDGATYKLVQFHFHSPSEHAIGGRTYPVEIHLVHKSDAGKLLVVGILLDTGADNAVLAPLWNALPAHEGPAVVVPGVTLDIASLLPSAPRYLSYGGSLTTPPCTEGVTWLVVEPGGGAQISPAQVATLRERTHPSTHRPLQAIGAREVVERAP